MPKRVITLLSGGLDSTTLAYEYDRRGYEVHCLSFDYGQRHKKELQVAENMAARLGAEHHIVRLGVSGNPGEVTRPLAAVLSGSALTDPTIDVPEGHYAAESMKATIVPNRNAIMLSIAYGVAVAEKADAVAFAAHAGDHAIYPDCRPTFVSALEVALVRGNRWDETTSTPVIEGLFLGMTKGEIALRAWSLGVPIAATYSCYKGGTAHCGVCGTCYERREALEEARVITGRADPTYYLDSTTQFEAPQP